MRPLLLLALLVGAVSLAGPAQLGKATALGLVDAGTLPVAAEGGLVWDTLSQALLASDGGTWAALGGGGGTVNFLLASMSTNQLADLLAGDHIKFDVVVASNGSDITLDTATAYTSADNVASVGRFTLAAGHVYQMDFVTVASTYSGTTGSGVFAFVNADTGAAVSPAALHLPSTGGAQSWYNGNVRGFFRPDAGATRVEVRIVQQTVLNVIGSSLTAPTTRDGGALTVLPHVLITEMF